MKQDKKVYVFNHLRRGLAPWPPADATGFMKWFQAQLGTIPSEYLSAARVEINTSEFNDCDMPDPGIEITYMRPETDAEEGLREKRAARETEQRRDIDLRKLAELKATYEGGGA